MNFNMLERSAEYRWDGEMNALLEDDDGDPDLAPIDLVASGDLDACDAIPAGDHGRALNEIIGCMLVPRDPGESVSDWNSRMVSASMESISNWLDGS